ncbi:phage tail protein I [Parasedimentitalea marina]|uniref:Phage tail protein I n=1 Tax=Parasedimentitalea marina TaxID=2483033 RepID=A0A3T0N1K0_9RHOB|nr:phage tail protein I [Parasedimentitalea marina]AZV77885.1 phage tail protein I [Parasedimentitalea marina]
MSDLPTILPPNSTALERALEQAIGKSKPDLTAVATLMNPDTCPAPLLGWLAWAFSVDVWGAAWSEAEKRDTIRQSIAVHRVKGTRGAVRRVLASLGFRTDISEWFEYGGAAHTFRVDAFGDDILGAGLQIDQALFATLSRVLDNVKPASAHYELRIGQSVGATVALRTGARSTQHLIVASDPIPRPSELVSAVSLRASIRMTRRSEDTHDPAARANTLSTGLCLRSALRPKSLSRVTHLITERAVA